MKVLITGAGGFIGKNLLLGLSQKHDLLAVDRLASLKDFIERCSLSRIRAGICDLSDEAAVAPAARAWGEEQEAVVYLAGNGDPGASVPHPLADLKSTVVGLINFLVHFQVGRMVYFSSGAVYDGISGPVSPDSRLDPRLPYAISKLACEQYVKFFHKAGRIKEYIILRFFGAYGPYEPPRKIYTRLARAFYLEGKNEFIIRGDGRNLIDAMFVDDTVRAVSLVLAGTVKNEVVDFCVGQPLSLRELVEEAARIFQVKGAKVRLLGEVPEYITFRPSAQGMKRLFDFSPSIPLAEGLPRLARFLKEVSHD